ncbi:MAG: NAD-dependent epimerase/dehydratase family protein [Pseudomonadota bacterium]
MQRFCVVGGGGFIGTNLVRQLLERGHPVRVFGHTPRFPSALVGCERFDGEFSDNAALAAAVEGQDVVVHLLGDTDIAGVEAKRAEYIGSYLKNTLQLLDYAAQGRFGRFLFVSSGGTVYGVPSRIPIQEESAQWPISSYGVNTLVVERYLHVYHHQFGIDYRIARLGNPFGPYQLPGRQGVVATLLHCALQQVPFPLMGDGSAVRDYLYVADAVEALARMATYQGCRRVFNIGSGVGHSLSDLIAEVEAITERRLVIQQSVGRSIDVPNNVLDIAQARHCLGWTPVTGLSEGIRQAAQWMRGHSASETRLDDN